ncbi:MAG: hypothetical protein WD469_03905 [Paenibacillaceae bacterium]
MKIRPLIICFIALCVILPNIIAPASAATSKVKVIMPKFAVEVNGKKIDNKHALYPLLVYKNITYFPMTIDYAKALGLSIQWDKKQGLTILSPGERHPLKQDLSGNNSLTRTYDAQVVSFPIKVNEEKIMNSTEKYPLLLFRNITYFPMTWHFTHDLFHWNTEWNAATGYHIRSNQVPILFHILYDNANFLYVGTGTTESTYKINKALDGRYKRITDQENRMILEKAAQQGEQNALPQSLKSDELIVRKGDSIYYKEQKIVPLEPYLEKIEESKKTDPETDSGINYSANFIKLDDDNSLLILTVYYLIHIPGPYTPFEDLVFVIHQDQAKKVDGYTQWPDKLIKNSDGSYWISSYAPAGDLNTRNFYRLGQLALIDKNGMSYNINKQLKVIDIDVLNTDNQTLIIKAYNDRLYNSKAAETDGFFTIDTHATASKLADSIQGIGYVALNKDIFGLNPDKNTITNVTTKKSHTWWDYELRPDL